MPPSAFDAVELFVIDTNGIPRGKRIPAAELEDARKGAVRLIGSIFALDSHGENVDAVGLAMATGDGDRRLVPTDGRLLPLAWERVPTAALAMRMVEDDGTPFFADPRNVLQAVLARFEPLGLTPVVACELEFYLTDRARDAAGGPQPPKAPLTGRAEPVTATYSLDDLQAFAPFLDAVAATCRSWDVPASSALSEYAPGQFEINLHHVADAVAAADHAALLKRAVRGHARALGMDATFLAKPYAERAGSGLHIHVSLVDRAGRNVFAGRGEAAAEPLRHALGGLMATLDEGTAIFAPNPNSYRRLQRGSYAPVMPSWGFDNRTVALRVVGEGAARRIEHRQAGADANPYLVMAAVLAGIHHGLTGRIDPGPPAAGNAYEDGRTPLPQRLGDALPRFAAGAVLREHLGADFHRLYHLLRRGELERFERENIAHEHAWYLPVI